MHINYSLFAAGYCRHPERITIKGGAWCSQKYPAICALIQHPTKGNILFDTGYTERFLAETTKWPFSFYQKLTPVVIEDEQRLVYQLQQKGIKPEDIAYIILSHFHADHIAGVKDFPNAKIICSQVGFDALKDKKGIGALQKGFIPSLLPDDFESRLLLLENQNVRSLEPSMQPFLEAIDIFSDGSLMAVSLPGHAIGQYGLLFTDVSGRDIFLVADSCWSSKAYREFKLPAAITYLIHEKRSVYQETLLKLHQLYKRNKEIRIIPSHCQEIWHEIMEDSNG